MQLYVIWFDLYIIIYFRVRIEFSPRSCDHNTHTHTHTQNVYKKKQLFDDKVLNAVVFVEAKKVLVNKDEFHNAFLYKIIFPISRKNYIICIKYAFFCWCIFRHLLKKLLQLYLLRRLLKIKGSTKLWRSLSSYKQNANKCASFYFNISNWWFNIYCL